MIAIQENLPVGRNATFSCETGKMKKKSARNSGDDSRRVVMGRPPAMYITPEPQAARTITDDERKLVASLLSHTPAKTLGLTQAAFAQRERRLRQKLGFESRSDVIACSVAMQVKNRGGLPAPPRRRSTG